MIIKSFKHKIIVLFLLIFFIFGETMQAQQFKPNTEIGILLGASYYLGDLNTAHFNQSSAAAGLVIRKNIDKRFAYKTEIIYLNLRSDERNTDDTIASSRGLHFRSPVYELSGQVEFNFLPYNPGDPLYTWTPFVYGGVSIFNFNPQAENKNGEWVDLQEMGTEGQGTTTFPERQKYSLIQFSAALGGGVKIAVSNSFNIIFEYSTRKTFTDYLDDVSTTFPGDGLKDMSEAEWEMSDPLGTHLKDDQRGNSDKNDWYSFAGITLSFNLDNKTKG
jgi:hypothetical protein